MAYCPWSNEKIDMWAGHYTPNTKKRKSKSFDYWVRTLFQRSQSAIEMNLVPEWEDDTKDVLYYWLFKYGFVGVIDTKEFGLIFQIGNAHNFDIYYRPANFKFANPYMPAEITNTDYVIGDNCAIIKLTPDYKGIWDIIEYYAEKLSSLDNAINISIENSKIPMILGARNKAAAEFLKKVIDMVNDGESAVIFDKLLLNDRTDKDIPFQLFDRENVAKNYLTSVQLADIDTLLKQFDSQVGIPSIDNKGERMYNVEALARTVDSSSRAITWVNTLNRSFKNVKKVFPDSGELVTANLTFDIPEGGTNNVNNEYDDMGRE